MELVILPSDTGWSIYSVVTTSFGGEASNFITDKGTIEEARAFVEGYKAGMKMKGVVDGN